MTYLITGGVRSGKSKYAETLAKYFAEEILYVATLQPSDEEMQRRIAKHKAQRPKSWRTLEVKLELPHVIQNASEKVILIDCLSGFVSSLVLEHEQAGEEAVTQKVLESITELIQTFCVTQQKQLLLSRMKLVTVSCLNTNSDGGFVTRLGLPISVSQKLPMRFLSSRLAFRKR
jgi:adenosylcobinamide kinase / adenosylcobinamide-phosphate guanylyltransferase